MIPVWRELSSAPIASAGTVTGPVAPLAEVAAAVDRTADTIKDYEGGRARPSARTTAALAKVLQVGIDELFGRYEDPILDYVDAVAQHGPPLTAEEVRGAAVVLRTVRRGRGRPERQVPA